MGSARHDPVLHLHPLPLRQTFYPLGFPLTIETDSAMVLTAACESWMLFKQRYATAPLTLRIGVEREPTNVALPVPSVRAQRDLISFIGDHKNFLVGDLAEGVGFGWVSPAGAAASAFFRYHYLEALALTLVDARHAATMHAACVAIHGQGVLLCGDSQAGKSSLAYACARRGWHYLSDDATYLLQGQERNVTGNCHKLRLRPDAGDLFPELRGRMTSLRGNGKVSMEIPTATLPCIQPLAECAIAFVVYLERQPEALVSMVPRSVATTLASFKQTIALGSTEQRAARVAQFRHLLEVPAKTLRYSRLDQAVDALESMVRGCGQ